MQMEIPEGAQLEFRIAYGNKGIGVVISHSIVDAVKIACQFEDQGIPADVYIYLR
jgi:hypothetical protein